MESRPKYKGSINAGKSKCGVTFDPPCNVMLHTGCFIIHGAIVGNSTKGCFIIYGASLRLSWQARKTQTLAAVEFLSVQQATLESGCITHTILTAQK